VQTTDTDDDDDDDDDDDVLDVLTANDGTIRRSDEMFSLP